MTEIAAGIAVLVALAALWLANQAFNQVSQTFDEFTQHLVKQIRESQSDFQRRVDTIQNAQKKLDGTINAMETRQSEYAEKINTLTQRISVLEHEVRSLNDSIPPQLRRPSKKRAEGAV